MFSAKPEHDAYGFFTFYDAKSIAASTHARDISAAGSVQ
jgi:hypothetical protein